MSRSARRRHHRTIAAVRQPVIIAGDGIVAAELNGSRFEAIPHAPLPPKIDGEHRWIATAAYIIAVETVEAASDPDQMKFLDHENLFQLGIGCWDCEQPLGAIQPGSHCPTQGDD